MRGYVQKFHLRHKTSDISETKPSGAKVTIQSDYTNSCTAYRLVTNLVTLRDLRSTFPGATFFHNGNIAHFCRSATKFGNVGSLANRKFVPNFKNFDPGFPLYSAATCISPSVIHL